jgi:hypothetical protein
MERAAGMEWLRHLLAWLFAVAVTAAAATMVQTQFNLAAIAALGAPVPAAARLETTLHDLASFAPLFAAITASAFLVAFLVAALLARFLPGYRRWLYTLAGVVAIATAIVLLNAMLPVTPIAATRSFAGFIAMALTGAPGGWAYAVLTQRHSRRGMA